ncbi:hypothetical protein LPB79_12985 [Rhizobium sp. T136]|uniref:Uncharacterized protein n=1 Tax=Rhizobium favelukesii TaxID=348824 RepID=W6RBD4_9HYPH|nr:MULTISPECIES: hypothetical protein [Rhizobium]UFS83161.1 hypothetical protein LPB79_12985 [Rhizobium sp. T136]CDM57635.1 putative predicted protein [Rhizobium favelukesii]
MGSVHNDLATWAGRARVRGETFIEVDIETAEKAAATIVFQANEIEALRARAEKAEAERAEHWRLRREAEASRDLEAAIALSLEVDRDAAMEEAKRLRAIANDFQAQYVILTEALEQICDLDIRPYRCAAIARAALSEYRKEATDAS